MKNLFVALFLGIGSWAYAQSSDVSLQIEITDQTSGEGIPQAQVLILNSDSVIIQQTLTNMDGKATATVEASVTYDIFIRAIGFRPLKKNWTTGSNTSQLLALQLAPHTEVLSEVVVMESAPIPERAQTIQSISYESVQVRGTRSAPNMDFIDRAKVRGNNQIQYNYSSPYDQENRENYNHNPVAGFLDPAQSPLSTFAMDVDRASYTNVRRMIEQSQIPPADAVRTEEFINNFQYDLPEAEGEHPFAVQSELSTCPWNDEHQILRVGLSTSSIPVEDLPPSNLVFLVDVSGSMHGPNRLGLVQQALHLLVNQLRPQDRVALVTYAGSTRVVLQSTDGDDSEDIKRAIDNLTARGGTNGAGGIQLAYKEAVNGFREGGSNRVILLTDGDFNVGISSQSELIRMIEEKRETGVFLSVIGVGQGNYQEGTMEQLANKGNGNFNYINDLYDAKKVFVEEFTSTLFTVAKDGKIQIEFNPEFVSGYRLLGYENRALNDEDFDNDAVDGGEVGMNHQVTAMYEIIPGKAQLDTDLRYSSSTSNGEQSEIATVAIRYKAPDADESKLMEVPIPRDLSSSPSEDQQFALAVAGFAGQLREDENMEIDTDEIIRLARSGKGEDENGERANFIQVVQLFRSLHARNN